MKKILGSLVILLLGLFLIMDVNAASVIAKGSCGDNATWVLDSEGTLSISGTGDLRLVDEKATSISSSDIPWWEHHSKIKKLIINDGITSIYYYTFRGLENLAELNVASSVSRIYKGAFQDTKWEQNQGNYLIVNHMLYEYKGIGGNIVVPEGVESVYESLFQGKYVYSIVFPDSLRHLGAATIYECENLESIYFKGDLPDYTGYVVYKQNDTPLSIFYPKNNDTWHEIDSCFTYFYNHDFTLNEWDPSSGLPHFGKSFSGMCGKNVRYEFDFNSGELKLSGTGRMDDIDGDVPWYDIKAGIKSLSVSPGITYIYGFGYCHNLTKVNLNKGLLEIGNGAFESCSRLTNITIPDSVRIIREDAFAGNMWNTLFGEDTSNLKSIVFGKGLKTLEEGTLGDCVKLRSVYFKGNAPSVTGYFASGFYNLNKFNIYFPIDDNSWNSNTMSAISYQSSGKYSSIWIPWNPNTNHTYKVSKYNKDSHTYTDNVTDKAKQYKHIFGKGTNTCLVCGFTKTVKAIKSKVTFKANGGTVKTKSKTVISSKTYGSLPKATRTGYSFAGWYTAKSGGSKVTSSTTVTKTKDHTLYAHWTKIKYSITYHLNGGTNVSGNPATYTITDTVTYKSPKRTGYSFKGWYKEKSFKNRTKKISKGSTGNKKVFAKWSAHTYSVVFKGNGSSSGKMTTLSMTYGKAKNLPANKYQKTGYVFKGWSTSASGSVKYKNKQSVKNLTGQNNGKVILYAIWEPIKYTITYEYYGGTKIGDKDNPTIYTIKDDVFLATPGKTGYTFDGWYKESTYKTRAFKISKGSTGNKKFYAKWVVNKYCVIFEGNGAKTGSTDVIYDINYGDTFNLSKNGFKKIDYDFVGWSLTPNGKIVYSDQEAVKNLTAANGTVRLYAQWKAQPLSKGENGKTISVGFNDEGKCLFRGLYSDDYFSKSANIDQGDLAMLSVLGAASTYQKNGEANYSAKFLKDCGFIADGNFIFSKTGEEDGYSTKDENNHARVQFGYKELTVNGTPTVVVAVLINGYTKDGYEWLSNFNVGDESEHYGFYKASDEVKTCTDLYIDKFKNYLETDRLKLWIMGHSRAAAITNIIATDYNKEIGTDNVYAYGFATPRYSKKATSYQNIKNYIIPGDFVTKVAPTEWGFTRNNEDGDNLLPTDEKMELLFYHLVGVGYTGFGEAGANSLLNAFLDFAGSQENYNTKRIYISIDGTVSLEGSPKAYCQMGMGLSMTKDYLDGIGTMLLFSKVDEKAAVVTTKLVIDGKLNGKFADAHRMAAYVAAMASKYGY